MGHNPAANEAVLKEVLGISRRQRALFAENRLSDLLEGQRRKKALLDSLESGPDYKREPYASVIKEIIDSDRTLTLGIEALRDEVGDKLKRIKSGVKAMRAYGGGFKGQ